jgi:hypothetical protein
VPHRKEQQPKLFANVEMPVFKDGQQKSIPNDLRNERKIQTICDEEFCFGEFVSLLAAALCDAKALKTALIMTLCHLYIQATILFKYC